jgi:hypothetical protein
MLCIKPTAQNQISNFSQLLPVLKGHFLEKSRWHEQLVPLSTYCIITIFWEYSNIFFKSPFVAFSGESSKNTKKNLAFCEKRSNPVLASKSKPHISRVSLRKTEAKNLGLLFLYRQSSNGWQCVNEACIMYMLYIWWLVIAVFMLRLVV